MSKPTLAFFGATGGCCNTTLALALQAGYQCTALARTPSKLRSMLEAQSVPEEVQSRQLRIVQGDVKDLEAVKETLKHDSGAVDMIVSGIGMILGRAADTTICQTAMRSVVAALQELKPAVAPFLVCISTTGITDQSRDVPYLLSPLYHVLLAVPHKDKRVMEALVVDAAMTGILRGYTIARPTLLFDGPPRGLDVVRAGTAAKPAIGYYIRRSDVGGWLFEECVKDVGKKWNNQAVSLTF